MEINNGRVALYRGVMAKLALSDPTSEEFERLQREAEALWAELTLDERAVAHEANANGNG